MGWSLTPNGDIFLSYKIDINTGIGDYIDLNTTLNSYSFTNDNNIITFYARY